MSLDCTALIKTFNRPSVLFNLLQSIRLYHQDIPIVVTDDSDDSMKERNKSYCEKFNALYVELPFDVGLSVGRNEALKYVKTKYTHIFDDDNLLTDASRFEKMQYILDNTNYDLIGTVTNKDRNSSSTYCHNISKLVVDNSGEYNKYYIECSVEPKEEFRVDSPIDGLRLYKCQVTHNNFMAETEKLKSCQWIPELKLEEHIPFFADWYLKGYTCVCCPDLILNATIFVKKRYRNFRKRRFLRENELKIKYVEN